MNELLIENKLKTSSLSYIADINIQLSGIDLLTIALYLKINSEILSFELNYLRGIKIVQKGSYMNSKSKSNFYNQITLLLNISNDPGKVDAKKVKLFIGGRIHLCGCHAEEDIVKIFDILKRSLSQIKVKKTIDFYPLGGLIVDDNDIVYNPAVCKPIGVLDVLGNIYIDGNKVLPKIIILANKENHLETHEIWVTENYVFKKHMVYDNGGNTIGLMDKQSREIEYSKVPETFPIDFSNEFVFDLSEKSKSMELSNVKIILLNSYYKIRGVILKEKFKIYMDKLGYHTSYEPVIYHALKTMYYFGEYAKNGICFCYKNKSIDIKHTCSCIKNTCIISSNGSVLLYGFKSYEQRDIVYEWLNVHLKASSCV